MNTPEELVATYERASWAKGRADQIVDDYLRLAYDVERHASVKWFGQELWKESADVVMYAEIIHETRPTLIVESGTFRGGSALFFAHMLDLIGEVGRVVSVDVKDWGRPTHPRIDFVTSGSTDPDLLAWLELEAAGQRVMVSLDSDHTFDHVYAELEAYGPLVSSGCYLVCEDTNLGHDVLPEWGPGPAEAVAKWLPEHPEFNADPHRERLLLSQHAGGWLKRS